MKGHKPVNDIYDDEVTTQLTGQNLEFLKCRKNTTLANKLTNTDFLLKLMEFYITVGKKSSSLIQSLDIADKNTELMNCVAFLCKLRTPTLVLTDC